MQYFYDGQVRRYLTQIVRAFSKFSYKDLEGKVNYNIFVGLNRVISNGSRSGSGIKSAKIRMFY